MTKTKQKKGGISGPKLTALITELRARSAIADQWKKVYKDCNNVKMEMCWDGRKDILEVVIDLLEKYQ